MRSTTLIAVLWLLFCSFTSDPIKISVKDILSSVQKERRVITNVQTVDFLNRLNYRLPVVKDLGLRYGTDDLTNAKRQYAASLGFNSFKVIKEQQALKNAQLGVYQAKKDLMLGEVIRERYTDMVDVYFSQMLIDKHKQLDILLNQKSTVLKESLKKGIPIKVKDLVETEDDIRSLRMNAAEMDNMLTISYQHIREFVGIQSPFTLHIDNFITVSKLEEILNIVKLNRNFQTRELRVNQSKVNLAQTELKLEEASFKQVFDNFQLIYEHKKITDFSTQDFSFRLGFNIPIKGNFRPKQNELLLEIKEAENDFQMSVYETEREIKTQVIKMESLIKQYKHCQETLNNGLSNTLLNTPSVAATLTPSDIADLKIIQQKKEIEMAKTQYALMQEYIKLLDLTGELSVSPYKNYLSNVLEKW